MYKFRSDAVIFSILLSGWCVTATKLGLYDDYDYQNYTYHTYNRRVRFDTKFQFNRSNSKRSMILANEKEFKYYNVGVLMASHLDSPFDLERCGPAVDLALERVNEEFLKHHRIRLRKVQGSYPSCSGEKAPGLAGDMHFRDEVIAFIGPSCAFALEPVARLAAYWNVPIITGMGDQAISEFNQPYELVE